MAVENSNLEVIGSKVSVRFNDKIDATFAIPKTLPLPVPVLRGRGTIFLDAESNSEDPDDSGESLQGKKVVIKARRQLNADIRKYMPRLIATRDVPFSSTNVVSPDPENPKKRHCPRALRLLLFRKLVPLQELTDVNNIVKALKDSFICHYALWQKGIEYGDVSVWNIMWGATNKCGVLNDWDLSLVVGEERKTKERTGTLPFMARDLITGISKTRLYRHEVESVVWVFIWICLGGTQNATVKGWYTGDHKTVGVQKSEFLLTHSMERVDDRFAKAWEI